MSKYLLLGCLLLIGIASLGVHATITFQPDTEQCLGQLVEYQCTVDAFALNWRVFNESQAQLSDGFATYTNGGIVQPSTIGGGMFTVEQLQQSPVISNISFTVQSSINGYTIQCEDGITMTNENLIINITGPPPPPTDITDITCTDDTTADITWTPPSTSQCITSYTIINTTTNNSINNTTDTSTSISLTGLSNGTYCISIASIDTANRIGTYSEQECFEIIDPPPPPNNINIACTTSTTAEVTWTQPNYSSQYCNISGYTINTTTNNSIINTTDTSLSLALQSEGRYNIRRYNISIASIDTANRIGNYSEPIPFELAVPSEPTIDFEVYDGSTNDTAIVEVGWTFDSSVESCVELTAVYLNVSNESYYNMTMLPANTTEYNITIMINVNYNISVFGMNVVGNGISNITTISVDANGTLFVQNVITDPLTATTPTATTTDSPSSDSLIVPIVVPVVIVFIIILIVVTLTLIFICYKMKQSGRKSHPSTDNNYSSKGSSIQMKPTGGNKQDTPPDQTLYADLEVSTSKPPPSSSKKNVKPSTVEYSPVKHGVEYTELSHSQPVNRVGKKPDTIEPVNYSAVSHR